MKKRHKKMCSAIWALLLALALVVTPMNSMQAFAEEMQPEVVEEIQPEVEETEEIAEEEQPETEEPEEVAEEVQQEVVVAEADVTDGPTGDNRLVYGDANLADEDALVLMLAGDGFTKDEQEKFYEEAEKTANYIMKTSPWDECQDLVKIYAIGVVSNESGARADQAKTQEEADADTRDTYFHTQFWTGGMQRLLALGTGGGTRVNEVKKAHCPSADFNVVMVNTEVYGGSGGSTCVVSLNTETFEMMLHELGHTVGDLSDEYFAGASYANDRQVNMTNNNDPETIKWKKFLGKNGVGIYEHTDGGAGWYKPHQGCKMEYLGQQYPFCEVCKEQLRKSFCQYSNVTKMFFQPYNTIFYETDTAPDMAQYFILRKAKAETTGDQVGDALTLTYYKDGELLSEAPYEAGDYMVKAEFAGNETYDAYTLEVPYTIELKDLITLSVKSKVYDGTPAELDYTINYDKEYTVEAYYTGTITYSKDVSEEYASEDAPIVPGEYKVVLTAKDAETGKTISKKSVNYKINFKTTVLQDNNDPKYEGAAIYYNNQTIAITGEGFTAEEQDKFEAIAKKYVEYLQNTEPLKETNLYFNYSTVEAVSKESGISTHNKAKDTYFGLSLDKKGNIVEAEDSAAKATYLGYYQVTAYYKGAIVIVNDDKIREGSLRSPSKMVIYAGADEEGMKFAAQEIVNSLAGYEIGTDWSKDEATKEAARIDLLKKIYYFWYGTSYSPITSRAYDELFVEKGTAYDLAPYFHTYVSGKEAPDVSYDMTYYKNDNGKLGEKLDGAPSEAGEYFALAELQMDGKRTKKVVIDGTTYSLPFARGLVPYTITKVREGNPNKADNPNKPIKPAKPANPNKPVKPGK